MGVEKVRRKAVFKDGLTTIGSAGFSGPVDVNTTMRIGGAVTANGVVTFSAAPIFNREITAPTGSSASQRFGYIRINSGATSATQSTTALNSGALLIVGAGVLVGAAVASYNLVGELVVNTIAQAASGGYFTVGFSGSNAYAASLDVPWFIINPA